MLKMRRRLWSPASGLHRSQASPHGEHVSVAPLALDGPEGMLDDGPSALVELVACSERCFAGQVR